ncbi:MAG: alkaline phosphatase [Bacteroidales bacterium]|nr:alkaline phosphatase [Bacteroidales bacterium]MDD3200663.1 alkaline phosphatase [Bacteroidales bacterium]
MKKQITLLCLAVLLVLSGCCSTPKVKNVIYIIGDGMGHADLSLLVREQQSPSDQKPAVKTASFEKAQAVGLVKTYSANAEITDSAAGGTALSTGKKTNNDMVGLSPGGDTLTSVLVEAQKLGKKTGIVVSCYFIDATPAAFFAHAPSRKDVWEISRQFVDSDIDLLFGGGMDVLTTRPDSVSLIPALEEKGYAVYSDWSEALKSDAFKIVALPKSGYVYERPENYLPDGLIKATEVLSKENDKGFFLMVESSFIDGYGHRNQRDSLYEEMVDIDRTFQIAMDFADTHPGTLVIMTADHETGGVTLTYNGIEFSTKGHTATMVPLFAYGQGAEYFGKVMDNTEVPKIIERLMRGQRIEQ